MAFGNTEDGDCHWFSVTLVPCGVNTATVACLGTPRFIYAPSKVEALRIAVRGSHSLMPGEAQIERVEIDASATARR